MMAFFGPLRACVAAFLVAGMPASWSQVPSNYVPLHQAGTPAAQTPRVFVTIQTQESEQSEESEDSTNDASIEGIEVTSKGIEHPNSAIIALGHDSRDAQKLTVYTRENYPGINYSQVQKVKDTQAQYAETLASQDIINLLGHPFSQMYPGHGRCLDGNTGELATYYYLVRDPVAPKSMVTVRFCNDGMQSIGVQNLR